MRTCLSYPPLIGIHCFHPVGGDGVLAALYASYQGQGGDVSDIAGHVQLSRQLHGHAQVRLRPLTGADPARRARGRRGGARQWGVQPGGPVPCECRPAQHGVLAAGRGPGTPRDEGAARA